MQANVINVIGYIQRQLPAHLAKAYCSGFKEKTKPKKRGDFAFANGSHYFPLETDGELGRYYAVTISLVGGHAFRARGHVDGSKFKYVQYSIEQCQQELKALRDTLLGLFLLLLFSPSRWGSPLNYPHCLCGAFYSFCEDLFIGF